MDILKSYYEVAFFKFTVLPKNMHIPNNFWLVGFYGISTIVGYLKPNPVNTCMLDIYDL